MEKIVITEEEKNALVQYISAEKNRGEKTTVPMIEYFVARKSTGTTFNGTYSLLNRFTPEQFALLLCGWYEVEQPFKVGDWVKWTHKKETEYLKIKGKKHNSFIFSDDSTSSISNSLIYIEKVTEPWKIMLLELGRDKPEFNRNDIIVTNGEVYKADWLTDKEIIELYNEDLIKEFHAYENRIEVKGNVSTQ